MQWSSITIKVWVKKLLLLLQHGMELYRVENKMLLVSLQSSNVLQHSRWRTGLWKAPHSTFNYYLTKITLKSSKIGTPYTTIQIYLFRYLISTRKINCCAERNCVYACRLRQVAHDIRILENCQHLAPLESLFFRIIFGTRQSLFQVAALRK